MSRIDELDEAAQKATPGPWTDKCSDLPASVTVVPGAVTVEGLRAWKRDDVQVAIAKPNDRAYIALADPQTVMALVEVYRAADQVDTYSDDPECIGFSFARRRLSEALRKVRALDGAQLSDRLKRGDHVRTKQPPHRGGEVTAVQGDLVTVCWHDTCPAEEAVDVSTVEKVEVLDR